ncbi:MAG: dihydroxyacetone kinase subunit DhaL [Cyanobacteriota bacterium]
MDAPFSLAMALRWLQGFHDRVLAQEIQLTELDAAIGDADHSTNMARGVRAVIAQLEADPPATLEALFRGAGMALVRSVGGASGPLYGTFFLRCAAAAGPTTELNASRLIAVLGNGLVGIAERGHAAVGDKTMLDALAPALEALEACLASGAPMVPAAAAARAGAAARRAGTGPLLARRGRASYLGERSIGPIDPGATSMALLIEALAAAVA